MLKKLLEQKSLGCMFRVPSIFGLRETWDGNHKAEVLFSVRKKIFRKNLENVLTSLIKKNLMDLFPSVGSSLKLTLCD